MEKILAGEDEEWLWVRKIPSFQANLAKILTGGGRTVVQVRKNVKNYHLRDGMELVGENEGRYLICVYRVSMIE